MIKQALGKLNNNQINYCEALYKLICENRDKGSKAPVLKNSGKLRGYLECLCQMNVITEREVKELYFWFFAERPKIKY